MAAEAHPDKCPLPEAFLPQSPSCLEKCTFHKAHHCPKSVQSLCDSRIHLDFESSFAVKVLCFHLVK